MARVYLVGIFGLVCAANAILFWFTFSQHNPWRSLVGVMFGQFLSTVLLLCGVWKRLPWARYVLATLLIAVVSLFALITLMLANEPEAGGQRILGLIWFALGLLVIADTWLIRSKRIQYLASQPGSGG